MKKNVAPTLLRISILSLIIIGVMQTGITVFGQNSFQSSQNVSTENKYSFESAGDTNLGTIGVAIGTKIGTRMEGSSKNVNTTVFNSVSSVPLDEREAKLIRTEMIQTNMLIIQEYLNLLRTDILTYIEKSSARERDLNTLIAQLELRFRNATISANNLRDYRDKLTTELTTIQGKIDSLKTKIDADFAAFDERSTIQNVDTYLELRKEYQRAFTDVIYINQFLRQYEFLNGYNKKLLDTLINNKEALANQSFVVIPDSGSEFLRTFRLIYDEAEYKSLIEQK